MKYIFLPNFFIDNIEKKFYKMESPIANGNCSYLSDKEIYEQFLILKESIIRQENETSTNNDESYKREQKKKEEEIFQKIKTLLYYVCIKYSAIQYGNFILKSKKKSTYFFSSGRLNNMVALNIISFLIAHSIRSKNIQFDYIFGASYKGIPIATLTSQYLFTLTNTNNIFFLYDRKEEKTYGDKTTIIGLELPPNEKIDTNQINQTNQINETGDMKETENEKEVKQSHVETNGISIEVPTKIRKTIIIDDVFTCGTAAGEILNKLQKCKNIKVVAIFTILNRNEYELNEKNEKIYYKDLFEQKHNIPIYSLLTYEEDLLKLMQKI